MAVADKSNMCVAIEFVEIELWELFRFEKLSLRKKRLNPRTKDKSA